MSALGGPRIVYLVLAVLLLIAAKPVLMDSLAEESVRWAVRRSIDFAFVLFFFSFGASALRQLWKSELTLWLRQNRRYLGISFALAFLSHAALILLLANVHPEPFLSDLTAEVLYTGIVAFSLAACMLLTSNDVAVKVLRAGWSRLHTVSCYIIASLFLITYATSLHIAFFWPFFIATVVLFGMRLVASRQRRLMGS